MRRTETRQSLLDAAAHLVLNEGVAKLTLEAVAQAAGVSKGGVFYHFASKNALLAGMVAALIAAFEQDHARYLATDRAAPGAWTRAYVRASLLVPEAEASAALIAAVAHEPGLLDAFRVKLNEWQGQIERDGLDPTAATIVALAVDGLWYAELLGVSSLSGAMRQEIVERLLVLSGSGGGSSAGENPQP